MPRPHRFRHHVNPLAVQFAVPRALPVEIPSGGRGGIEVELGCADAQFTMQSAAAAPDRFFIGLDIREALVELVQRRAERLGLANVRIAYCNLNVDLDRIVAANRVDRFHLLFPDPWFKSRHAKRRAIEATMLDVIYSRLVPGGELHIASDVFDIAMSAMAEIDGDDPRFENLAGPWRFWRGQAFAATSRREDTTIRRGQRVWRVRWRKTS